MYAKTVVHVRIKYGISTKRKIKQSVSRLEYVLVWSAAPPPSINFCFQNMAYNNKEVHPQIHSHILSCQTERIILPTSLIG